MVTMESPDPVDGSQIKDRGGSSSNKKKKNLTLGSFKSPFKFLGKTYCKGCRKKCSGEVLRVNDVYFHSNCFKCKGCSNSLSQGGFFTRDKVTTNDVISDLTIVGRLLSNVKNHLSLRHIYFPKKIFLLSPPWRLCWALDPIPWICTT